MVYASPENNFPLAPGLAAKQKGKKNNAPVSLNEWYPGVILKVKRSRAILRRALARMNKAKFKPQDPEAPSPVLILSYHQSLRRSKIDSTNPVLKDIIFSQVSKLMHDRNSYYPRGLYIDRRYPVGTSSIKELRTPGFPYDLYELKGNKEQAAHNKKMKELWNSLRNSKDFQGSFVYSGIDLWPLMADYVAFMFIKQFPEASQCIRVMEHILEKEGVKVALLHNETGFYGRALIIAARKSNVITIGLQHGNIGHKHIEYTHEGDGDALPCPVPDITAVWGRKDRNALLGAGGYSEEQVSITGNPRYDGLSSSKDKFSRSDFVKRFGIKEQKIIAVTTQPFPMPSERDDWLNAVISASAQIKDAMFVIKPHPAETTEKHEATCQKLGGNNTIILKDINIEELLAIADITITAWSTTGLESMMIGTPLIVVDLLGQEEKIPYVSSGAAVKAASKEEIVNGLRDILDNGPSQEMRENMNSYVLDHMYKNDGLATQRLVEIVENSMKSPIK